MITRQQFQKALKALFRLCSEFLLHVEDFVNTLNKMLLIQSEE